MAELKLKHPAKVGGKRHQAGDVIDVKDLDQAAELVDSGAAEPWESKAEKAAAEARAKAQAEADKAGKGA